MNRIPMEECEDRRLYRIHSHNLIFGVYNAKAKGFLGIREKGVAVYVFQEYHRDLNVGHATVSPMEALGEQLPGDILLKSSLEIVKVERLDDGRQQLALEDGYIHEISKDYEYEFKVGTRIDNFRLHFWLQEKESKYSR